MSIVNFFRWPVFPIVGAHVFLCLRQMKRMLLALRFPPISHLKGPRVCASLVHAPSFLAGFATFSFLILFHNSQDDHSFFYLCRRSCVSLFRNPFYLGSRLALSWRFFSSLLAGCRTCNDCSEPVRICFPPCSGVTCFYPRNFAQKIIHPRSFHNPHL